MTDLYKSIFAAIFIVAIVSITVSIILSRKAYSNKNKKLGKTAKVFETIGTSFATFALGKAVRVVFFT